MKVINLPRSPLGNVVEPICASKRVHMLGDIAHKGLDPIVVVEVQSYGKASTIGGNLGKNSAEGNNKRNDYAQ